ncbi:MULTISPECIES: hypothetical protein [unclassified Microcoleus]|jgi:hypothetical protein|uniref:hypothetical protein n=1 Tax=unclassified Microcoleus TaxID=2642155 RepID=UPI002FD2AA06
MATTTHTHKFSDRDAALIAAKKDIVTTSAKTWRAFLFNDPAAAAAYGNTSPPQGPGEIVFSVLPDGKVWVFPYF